MNETVLLDAGSGGRASQRLIKDIFHRHFHNDLLDSMDDAALLAPPPGKLAMSTDSHTVTPLFFAGGSIGTLAINGTVNDVSMLAAAPLWLTCAFIIEEGLPLETLNAVAADMALAAAEAKVKIVSGDTKVVPKGACDKLFVNTAGIGQVLVSDPPGGAKIKNGDAILVSGSMGDHGMAILAAREDLSFLSDAHSDCAPLSALVFNLVTQVSPIHALRDPTRGGLATTLNELAEQSNVCMEIYEDKIPVTPSVLEGCSFLGLDPLYLANEGKCICILPNALAEQALQAMRNSPHGENAAIIGHVTERKPGTVILHTRMGGQRYLGMLEGALLPRIC